MEARGPSFSDAMILLGLGSVCWGLWCIWPPLMWVVLGLVLMFAGLWIGAQRVSDRESATTSGVRRRRNDE